MTLQFICQPCTEREHQKCPSGTWCDCQHQPPPAVAPAVVR